MQNDRNEPNIYDASGFRSPKTFSFRDNDIKPILLRANGNKLSFCDFRTNSACYSVSHVTNLIECGTYHHATMYRMITQPFLAETGQGGVVIPCKIR